MLSTRTRRRALGLTLALGLAAIAVWAADHKTFLSDDPMNRDVITITSDAPLEFMVTRTQEFTGAVSVDPENILNEPEVTFEVPVSSLDTGIPLRNEHMMAERWLDAAEHPTISFALKEIKTPYEPTPLMADQPLHVDAIGDFTFKGETHEVPVKATVTYLGETEATQTRLPGEVLKIEASFDFLLSDHGMKLPAQAMAKIANRQQVELVIFTSTEKPAPPQG